MFFVSLLINLLINVNFVKTEDEIAVDRPRVASCVGSSFHIHESFASVGSFATCMDQPLKNSLTSRREMIFEYTTDRCALQLVSARLEWRIEEEESMQFA